jgi:LuxR family transcriptional regulator
MPAEELQSALEEVRAGRIAVHPPLLSHLADTSPEDTSPAAMDGLLTDVQRRTLCMLADGYSSKEIARATGKTMAAVNHSIERATRQLGATNRTQAVANAIRLDR